MNKSLLFLVLLMLSFACGRGERLCNGDLIFVAPQMEADGMDTAIVAATGGSDSLNFTHVAIVEVQGDSVWVIDATGKRGVSRRPLEVFLEDFPQSVFAVRRVKGVDASAAVSRARSYCGRFYDYRFLPDNEDLYCSELVQKCYLDASGALVFPSEPMNWLAPDGNLPAYWEELFHELGMDVPQGVPGTNPQKMSQSACLVPVTVRLVPPFGPNLCREICYFTRFLLFLYPG